MRAFTFISMAIAGLAFTSVASAANADPFTYAAGGASVSIASDREACLAQAALPWCGGATPAARGDWTVDEVRSVAAGLLGRFHYSFKYGRPWRSSVEKASQGQESWKDDCAGVTFTTLDALARAGFPTNRMWRLIVIPDTRKRNASPPGVLHMVGVVEVGGQYWVVGDTNELRPYLLSQAEFVPTMASSVADGRMWRRTEVAAVIVAQ